MIEYFENLNDGKYLIINSLHLSELINYINKNQIKSVYINDFKGYKEKDLSFLAECPLIEKVFVTDGEYDLSAIKKLSNLKSLIIGCIPKDTIDLLIFSKLEVLSIIYHKNWQNVFSCKSIRKLHLWKYKADNLEEFETLQELSFLELIQSPVTSLKGLFNLRKLIHFEGHNLPKLKKLGIVNNVSNLHNFHLYDCKNLENHQEIGKIKSIKSLKYCNCGTIESIKFIKDLPELHEFRIPKTDVKDGDMSPLKDIETIFFTNKKHFSHKYEDFLNG